MVPGCQPLTGLPVSLHFLGDFVPHGRLNSTVKASFTVTETKVFM